MLKTFSGTWLSGAKRFTMTDLSKPKTANPGDAARAAFVEAVESGSLEWICSTVRRLLATADSPTRAAKFVRAQVEARPPEGLQPYRLVLLSSFSIELVDDPLWAHGLTEGLDLQIHKPGFDLYRQEILDPTSTLYNDAHDAMILAVDGPRWAPGLYDHFLTEGWRNGEATVRAALDDIATLVRTFRERSNVPILFHSLVPPRFPQLGVLDPLERNGQARLIAQVNQGLGDLAAEIQGFYPIDLEAVVRDLGYRYWYEPRFALFARSPIARSAMNHLARTYLRYLRALTARSRKCLVLDLDDTLWGGVLGEEGPLGVELGSEYPGNAFVAFQQAVLDLSERGVLLAIASKNNASDVDEIFARNAAMVLKPEHFSAKQIHWGLKSLSLERIAKELNLDLKHIVFADNNPAECAEVALSLPQVTTITLPSQPERYIEAVFGDGFFDTLSVSAEDKRRAELYRQRADAKQLRQSAGSLTDYYRSLEMTVYLTPVTEVSLPRAAQMTQKTNQFNATTHRYTEADVARRMSAEDWITLTARVTDRFGDNGIVCLAMAQVQGTVLDIETFLMSCRVIGRTVETALLHQLVAAARIAGLEAVEGWIIPTKRNMPVRDLYERHGFNAVEEGEDGRIKWRLVLASNDVTVRNWLTIVDESEE